jgi:lysozyme
VNASRECRDFIRGFETLCLNAYLPTPDDVWTIGYGHTGPDVYQGLVISQATADILFLSDLAKFEHGVERLVKVPLNQHQFDALVSFSFNVGLDEDVDTKAEGLGDSTLLKLINARLYEDAAPEFLKWNKQGGKELPGLARRRMAEMAMFLEPVHENA